MSGVARIITPPKPNRPTPPPDPAVEAARVRQEQALARQEQAVQAETDRLNRAEEADRAAARARAGRAAGRGLLLNDEVGLPKTLGG